MAIRPTLRKGSIGTGRRISSFRAAQRREETPDVLPTAPGCPFCGGTETEIMSAFGSHASVSTYWCRACGSPFELMKWRGGA